MKQKMRMRIGLVSAMVGALILTSCSSSEGSGTSSEASTDELTTLKVMTMGLTFDGALYGGIEQGFFKEEGLEIEVSVMANPPAGLAAAQSGRAHTTYLGPDPMLIAMNEGVRLQVVAAANGLPDGAKTGAEPEEFED